MKKISILILTHNAPSYAWETITSLNEVTQQSMKDKLEIIVLDNASENDTKDILEILHKKKYIDKLIYSDINTMFSKGNNIAFSHCCDSSEYVVLLNSDIKIMSPLWLDYMLENVSKFDVSAVSMGYVSNPDRGDGYCLLVKKELYAKYKLDEIYEWWGGITKFQANIIKDGHKIFVLKNHNKYLIHYGGKSGYSNTSNMEAYRQDEIMRLFDSQSIIIKDGRNLFSRINNKLANLLNQKKHGDRRTN